MAARFGLLAAAMSALAALTASAAVAAAPALQLTVDHYPTRFKPGGTGVYVLQVKNVGDAPTTGTVTLSDALPPGLTPTFVSGGFTLDWSCTQATLTCTTNTAVVPGGYLPQVTVSVSVDGGLAKPRLSEASASGGGDTTGATANDVVPIDAQDAPFGIAAGSFHAKGGRSDGEWETQAGGHPYAAATAFSLATTLNASGFSGQVRPVDSVEGVRVELPPGFVGNPLATPRCRADLFVSQECPPASQIGVVEIKTALFGNAPFKQGDFPIYNLVPPGDEPALFGFMFASNIVTLHPEVLGRGDDYRLRVRVSAIPQGIPVIWQDLSLWGVPAASSHNAQRAYACNSAGFCANLTSAGAPLGAGISPQPFLTNPTACDQESTTAITASSWQHRNVWSEVESVTAPVTTGCEALNFHPRAELEPATARAESPAGLNVMLHIPQNESASGVATPSLKKAVVTLPRGMAVNPSSAAGLGGCSLAQIDIDSSAEDHCPDSSAIGTVSIKTPLLEDPIPGQVYLAAQKDNPFGSLLALYIVARGPGFVIKLPGRVETDPQSGQLKATFDDNPQLPFEDLSVQFKSGPRAPLITPARCGTYTTEAALTPWAAADAPPVITKSSFEITSGPNDSPCPSNDLKPKLNAGTENPVGGSSSSFNLGLSRDDATQQLTGLDVSMPEGLTAKLAGVPYCPDSALGSYPSPAVAGTGAAELASPKCPVASQVGTATVGAGAGSNPFYVKTGKVYLAGPYKGQPLSLAIVTPAVAGPFDLGTVVVRSAIHVDPATAKISVASDPIPTILEGIPLDVRDIRVSVDRADFMRNPTSCDPMSIDATVHGAQGATAQVSNRFQVASCERLAFKPKLNLRLFGGTKRSDHPKFRAVLTQNPGEANIDYVQVALPHSEFLEQSHIKTICTRVQYAAKACPAGSVYGYAKAFTPLLDKPLEGPVYLRSSSNPLPDLVASLDGQIHVDLVGKIDSVRGGIRNTFSVIPDAPVSKFILTMQGGKKGLLVNSRNLCKSVNRATVRIDGQNGKTADQRPVLRSSCKKKRK